jgi:ketosteroid isomerase-like protein
MPDPPIMQDVLAAVTAARAAFIEAIRARDSSAIAGLYADGARLVAPATELVRGRDAVASFWQAGVETGIASVELDPDDVEMVSDVACELGRYALRLEAEDAPSIVDRGRYLLVYVLRGGAWQRAIEMLSPDDPARRP